MTEEFQKNKEKAKELYKQLDEIQKSLTNAVIIDGVNVAGCANLDSLICNCGVICKGRDCYYKQLKRLQEKYNTLTNKFFNSETDKTRLQQDSKQLTQWLDEARRNADFWCDKCTSLEQERDDIQDRLFTLADTYQEARNVCKHLEQENKELKEKFKQVFDIDNQECWNIAFLNDEKCKYRSALEEIRRTVIDIIEDNGRHNLSDFSSPIRIEKIINEVLNDI